MTGADLFSRKSVLQASVSKDARSGGSFGIAFICQARAAARALAIGPVHA
jgi:hypothetical protein